MSPARLPLATAWTKSDKAAMADSTMGHVLISGSSTGIGRACAIYLAEKGYSVIAGVRRREDGQKLEASAKLRSILLDVADAASIATAAQEVKQIVGEAGLVGIVNNAGMAVGGPVEFVSIEDWRRQFEVNVFGHIAVTQAMLPLIRKHVAGTGVGRVIFIGSIAGRVTLPIMGPYSSSKHAIAAVSAALRMELGEEGIDVCLIEPGAIQSEIWRKGGELAASIEPDSPARQRYGGRIDALMRISHKSAEGAIGADHVARLVLRCLSSRRPPARKVVGRDAKMGAILRRALPERWMDRILLWAMKRG
jgi:NAD(P)-dependent dehydrogenase (short-subunit alcohol dehydrogenase family)